MPGVVCKQVFYPKIERRSTVERNLRVTRQGNVLVVQEGGFDAGGEIGTTHRFGFEPARGDATFATRITSYSGGFVKNSQILQKVITVNYVPLKNPFQEVVLQCAALLPGLDSGN